ncbi:MAG: hypothetical protein J6A49_04980 [Clostridia bacterium]|nr:hypothetical protein [Clostridia bacterium]
MPELPDLQVIAQNLEKIYADCRLQDIYLAKSAKVNASFETYKELLVGKKVEMIFRFGKEIGIVFEGGHSLYLHLMREGKLFESNEGIKNVVLQLLFSNGKMLVMSDFMKQARVFLDPELTDVPDPLDEHFTIEYFKSRLTEKSRTAIKTFLIDQDNILGIGNAYADEILWLTKLSPLSKCGNLPENVVLELYDNIRCVLDNSIQKIKEISPDTISGEIRSFLNVHNKDRKLTPSGHEILINKIGGKITYFTEEQILY